MYLLSIAEKNGNLVGDTAELYLEIKPGEGRVFFQSFPISKIDTQISTRFAKEYACDFLELDCSDLDFFYTISSGGPLIGGPSAGASMAILTIALLDNKNINKNVIMTGTINSDGTIGPVGGISEKIRAAQENGFTKVLVPKWSLIDNEYNDSINFLNQTKNSKNIFLMNDSFNIDNDLLSINKLEVGNIREALFYFTGYEYVQEKEFFIPEKYHKTMKDFSVMLCEKTDILQYDLDIDLSNINISQEYDLLNNSDDNVSDKDVKIYFLKLDAVNQYNNSQIAMDSNKPYSAASFCYGTNVDLRELELLTYDNLTLKSVFEKTKNELLEFKKNMTFIESNSIMKLQTKQIVLERINDAEQTLHDINTSLIDESALAYAIERLYSARVWANFINVKSEKNIFNDDLLEKICKSKIMEAQERQTYVESIFLVSQDYINSDIDVATDFLKSNNSELCIYFAAQAKAKADALLTSRLIKEDNLAEFIDYKINYIKKEIAKDIDEEDFPIAALSYIEYAESLKDINPSAALIYSAYASEFSKLSMYAPKSHKLNNLLFYFEDTSFLNICLSIGLVFGLIISLMLVLLFKLLKRK